MATDDLLTRATRHVAYINREPATWWDDEHCLDNGQSAVVIDKLAAEVRALTDRLDAAHNLSSMRFVIEHRETLEAWLRGIRQGTWNPTDATKNVLASVLHLFLLDAEADEIRAATTDTQTPT